MKKGKEEEEEEEEQQRQQRPTTQTNSNKKNNNNNNKIVSARHGQACRRHQTRSGLNPGRAGQARPQANFGFSGNSMVSPKFTIATTVPTKSTSRPTARHFGLMYSFGGGLGRNGSIIATTTKESTQLN